jgi:hypothetical protein
VNRRGREIQFGGFFLLLSMNLSMSALSLATFTGSSLRTHSRPTTRSAAISDFTRSKGGCHLTPHWPFPSSASTLARFREAQSNIPESLTNDLSGVGVRGELDDQFSKRSSIGGLVVTHFSYERCPQRAQGANPNEIFKTKSHEHPGFNNRLFSDHEHRALKIGDGPTEQRLTDLRGFLTADCPQRKRKSIDAQCQAVFDPPPETRRERPW